jgi:hypothetical protein
MGVALDGAVFCLNTGSWLHCHLVTKAATVISVSESEMLPQNNCIVVYGRRVIAFRRQTSALLVGENTKRRLQ